MGERDLRDALPGAREPVTPRPGYRRMGEGGLLVEFANVIDPAVNRQVRALLAALDAAPPPGLLDLIPAYRTLLILHDPLRLTDDELVAHLDTLLPGAASVAPPTRTVTIPVIYGGEFGPDLDAVAAHTGLPPEEVIVRHSAATYLVYFIGFSPGYPYLGGLDPALATPRLAQPRTRVPAGSVAIGGQQTGIYPQETPGGWRIIGRTPRKLYDPLASDPFLLRPGDEVRLRPIGANEYAALTGDTTRPNEPALGHRGMMSAMGERDGGAALLVRAPGLMTTVQDLGRPGHGRYGVSIGGALDEGALRWANLLVGNPPEAAALEINLLGPTLVVAGERPIVAALTGADCAATLNGTPIAPWHSFRCDPGDLLTLGGCKLGARAYLAIGGGIAVPLALGSRGTDLIGRLGGLEGRALRAGDHVPLDPPAELPPLYAVPPLEIPQYGREYVARVILGPQDERITPESLAAFLTEPYTVGHESDRMGARLTGPPLAFRADAPGADILSEGIVTGAIQVPAGGQPIVLLAGHQTTGGYAKIATVIAADLWQPGQARPGDTVSFRAVTIAEARKALRQARAAIDPGTLVPLATGTAPMNDQQSATTTNSDGEEAFTAELSATAEHADWHPTAIEALLTRAAATGVLTLTLEKPGLRLHLRRGSESATATSGAPTTTATGGGATPPPQDRSEATITAPVLGIFYRAAKPDQPPLVAAGDRIEAGQVVGLIEVMKTFHEVTSDSPGRITDALVENGASVQYGQALFTVNLKTAD